MLLGQQLEEAEAARRRNREVAREVEQVPVSRDEERALGFGERQEIVVARIR